MSELRVFANGDGCWTDLAEKMGRGGVVHVTSETGAIQIARLASGTKLGRSAVSIRVDLPDGRTVIADLTLSLFMTAAKVFERYYLEELEK